MTPQWLQILQSLEEKAKEEKKSPAVQAGQHNEHRAGYSDDIQLPKI
jgi:hypothetical protein